MGVALAASATAAGEGVGATYATAQGAERMGVVQWAHPRLRDGHGRGEAGVRRGTARAQATPSAGLTPRARDARGSTGSGSSLNQGRPRKNVAKAARRT